MPQCTGRTANSKAINYNKWCDRRSVVLFEISIRDRNTETSFFSLGDRRSVGWVSNHKTQNSSYQIIATRGNSQRVNP
jgi:hypothetical protein